MFFPTTYTFTGKYDSSPTDVLLHCGKYANGRLALRLVNLEWEPLLTVTVNLPEVLLQADEVAIKDWSENEGVLDFLLTNRIVQRTGRVVPTGFVEAPICKFLLYDQVGEGL